MEKKTLVNIVVSIVILSVINPGYAMIDDTKSNMVNEVNKTTSERSGRSLQKECSNGLTTKCMKIHVLSFLEDLSSRDELQILPGLSIVKENKSKNITPEELAVELSRKFPGKPEEKLNRFLLYRLQDYLDGHSLRFKLLDPDTAKDALSTAQEGAESARRRHNRGGGGGGLIAAALMAKGALAAAALGALALLAGKALMAALMSLLLSALVGLKGHGGHKSTTYEIITKPEVSHHHSHSHEETHEHDHGHHGGYRRAYEADYNSYMPYDTSSQQQYTTS